MKQDYNLSLEKEKNRLTNPRRTPNQSVTILNTKVINIAWGISIGKNKVNSEVIDPSATPMPPGIKTKKPAIEEKEKIKSA